MRHAAIALLLATVAMPAQAASPDRPPSLTPADAAEVKANCDANLVEAGRLRTAFEAGKGGKPGAVLRAYDDVIRAITNSNNDASLISQIAPDDARRDAARDCNARGLAAFDGLRLSVPAWQRLQAIDQGKLDAVAKRALVNELARFDRNGVSRDPATRAKVAELKGRIDELGITFDKNIANGRRTVTAKPAELAGLPADYVDAHKPGADGLVTISTDYPDLNPVMSYATDEGLRQRLYIANLSRAYPQNEAVLSELLAKRDELAKLLGRPDFATLALEDKMAGNPEKVRGFIAQVEAAGRTSAQRDFDRIQARYAQLNPGKTLTPWSSTYVSQLIRKEAYSVDPQEVRQYFAYDKVRDGILQLTRDLFGVEIKPWKTALWDPAAEAYEMSKDGKLIGRFYFDTHPRSGKYQHANVVPLRNGTDGAVPVDALVTNFPTGLMEHRDVETFLHEYGHLIHGLFAGHQPYELSSWDYGEWDIIEAPSQMLENWVWDYDTLARFASNAKGETIPRELVARMNKARYFAEAYGDRRQLGLSSVSLALHSGPPRADLTAQAKQAYQPFGFIDFYPEGTHMEASFGHLNGYSAFYYTYMWSKVISTDLFGRFQKEGLRNQDTAAAYRKAILDPGGSRPAAQTIEDFLGRPLRFEAYEARLNAGE